jgi:hypothetical protein
LGTRDRSAAGIADHRGKVSDDQYREVTEILKIPELSKHDAVTEMDVGRRRVNSKFDIERATLGELGEKLVAAENALAPSTKTRELICRREHHP